MKIPHTQSGIQADTARWRDQLTSGNKALKAAGLDRLPGATLKTQRTTEGLTATKELFTKMFQAELGKSTAYMREGEHLDGLRTNAQTHFDRIVERTFDRLEERLEHGSRIGNFRKVLKQANSEAMEVLKHLKTAAENMAITDMRTTLTEARDGARDRPTPPPQLVQKDDGTFSLIRARPAIENLVLSGGGGKGVGMPPALSEMRDAGFLDGLKKVVGTSVGALNAVSVAVGQSNERMTEFAEAFEASWLHDNPELERNYGSIVFNDTKMSAFLDHSALGLLVSKASGMTVQSAIGVVAQLDTAIQQEIKSAIFDGPGIDDLHTKLDRVAEEMGMESGGQVWDRLETLAFSRLDAPRGGKMATFNDMKMLHLLMPEKFKEIELTGFREDTGTETIFKAGDEFGTMPIAFGARVSMAHPLIAKSVSLPEWSGTSKFSDGGIVSNAPTEAVFGGEDHVEEAKEDKTGRAELQETAARTVLMMFDDEGKAYANMHAPKTGRTEGKGTTAMGTLVGHTGMRSDWQADRDKANAGGAHTIVTFHGELGTMDVDASVEKKDAAKRQSTLKTLEQLVNLSDVQGGAYVVDVATAEEAFSLLSDSEIEALQENPPDLGDFAIGARGEASYLAMSRMYEMATT